MTSWKLRLATGVTLAATVLLTVSVYRFGAEADPAVEPAAEPTPEPVTDTQTWAAAWATAVQKPTIGWQDNWSVDGFADSSVRQLIRPGIGGESARITFSNVYGDQPLHITSATIGLSDMGAAVQAGTMRAITFDGAAEVSIPAGKELVSDAVRINITELEPVAVTMYFAEPTGPATFHDRSFVMSYRATGDHSYDTAATPYIDSEESWYYLSGLDVEGDAGDSVVAFGDSITDGSGSMVDQYQTFPDLLAERMAVNGDPRGVLNTGIAGNRLILDSQYKGDSAGARFDRDVLDKPGVESVIVLEGINDIGMSESNSPYVEPNPQVSAEQLINGYQDLIDRAHRRGVQVIGGTLLPFKGAHYFTERGETVRDTVNTWIRDSGEFDSVIDFDAAMASPEDPDALNPNYDSGDHLHPSSAGYLAMAELVDLSVF